jgi:hypothetical protein
MGAFSCYSVVMSNQVMVIDALSKTTLYETSIEKIADAYAFAAQMEEHGLDLEIITPGLAETLIRALGANEAELSNYRESLKQEIDDHNDSEFGCAICPPSKSPLT